MRGSEAVGWLLAALLAGAGGYCLARLCARREAPAADRQSDASEAVMGFGMALMAVPLAWSRHLPPALWLALFGTAALWSLLCLARHLRHRGPGSPRGHHAYHAAGHATMVYLVLVGGGTGAAGGGAEAAPGMAGMPEMPGMAAMGGSGGVAGFAPLTGALLLFFCAHALVSGYRLLDAGHGSAASAPGGSFTARLLRGRELPHACRIVMGLGMAAMLLLM